MLTAYKKLIIVIILKLDLLFHYLKTNCNKIVVNNAKLLTTSTLPADLIIEVLLKVAAGSVVLSTETKGVAATIELPDGVEDERI